MNPHGATTTTPQERDAVADYLDSLFSRVVGDGDGASDSLNGLGDAVSLSGRLKGRGGIPPPNAKKPPGAVPLFGVAEGNASPGNAVKNMAAMFAKQFSQRRSDDDDSSSSASDQPMSDFARALAARKKALGSKRQQQNRNPGFDLQSQLAAQRAKVLNDDEILISPDELPPPPNFPPPPPPPTAVIGDPVAPSASSRNLAAELTAAVSSVSILDAELLPRRSRPVRLVQPIRGPAVMYNRPTWSLTIRKEVVSFRISPLASARSFVF